MNDLQGQSDKMIMDKNVSSACDLPEIVVCNCKELTHNVIKDICVDEGVPMMHEKFLLNKEETVKVNENASESNTSEDNNPEECIDTKDVIELVVTGNEVSCKKPPPEDVVAESGSVFNKALTLRDIISMEDSHKPGNNVNTNEPEGNLGREILEQRKTGEKKSVSWRYLPSETVEAPEDRRLNNVFIEDYYDHHHLFARNFPNEFGAESFSESESGLGHITHPGYISFSGSLSARSDGSTVSGQSFAFPVLHQEWNSTPARMVRAEKRRLQKEKGWRHYSLLCCGFCRS